MTSNVYIGPAGWSYPDWKGLVYPRKTRPGFDPLLYLSSYFNLIEINSTFYRIPSRDTCRSWLRRGSVRGDLRFTVKAFRGFTHESQPAPPREVGLFKDAVMPLHEGGVLGAVLVQFPWSFRYSARSTGYIAKIADALSPLPVCVEVRHGSWAKPEAIDFFCGRALCRCGIDQPVIGDSLDPRTHVVGAAGAYFRLHGRNRHEWFKADTNRDRRYDYMYGPAELAPWAERIRDTASATSRVHVVLNNHFRGQAVANALELKAMLTGGKVVIPQELIEAYPRLRAVSAPPSPPDEGSPPDPDAQGRLF